MPDAELTANTPLWYSLILQVVGWLGWGVGIPSLLVTINGRIPQLFAEALNNLRANILNNWPVYGSIQFLPVTFPLSIVVLMPAGLPIWEYYYGSIPSELNWIRWVATPLAPFLLGWGFVLLGVLYWGIVLHGRTWDKPSNLAGWIFLFLFVFLGVVALIVVALCLLFLLLLRIFVKPPLKARVILVVLGFSLGLAGNLLN